MKVYNCYVIVAWLVKNQAKRIFIKKLNQTELNRINKSKGTMNNHEVSDVHPVPQLLKTISHLFTMKLL